LIPLAVWNCICCAENVAHIPFSIFSCQYPLACGIINNQRFYALSCDRFYVFLWLAKYFNRSLIV
jgi:hypothetical protein